MSNLDSVVNRSIEWSALTKTSKITPEVQNHLTKVYSTLGAALFMCGFGVYVNIVTGFGRGFLFVIMAFATMIFLGVTPNTKENRIMRFSTLMGFGFLEGLSLGPLIQNVIDIDPRIIMTAFLGTVCIFVCFSASAIYAQRRQYLYLGGLLFSLLNTLVTLSFLNFFFKSYFIFSIELYLGLFVFCGFVIFDTQLVIEKCLSGNKDYIWHSVELFLDFINIFVRLLIILASDKKKGKK